MPVKAFLLVFYLQSKFIISANGFIKACKLDSNEENLKGIIFNIDLLPRVAVNRAYYIRAKLVLLAILARF